MNHRLLTFVTPATLGLLTVLGATEASADQQRVHLYGNHVLGSGGDYVQTGETHAGSPVYVNEANGWYYLYQRADGTWYVSGNVTEDWLGTLAMGPTANNPFGGSWFQSDQGCVPADAVMVAGANDPEETTGWFDFTGEIYNDAPVYSREANGTTWSLYQRSSGQWVVDSNDVSEDADGTTEESDAVDWPWEGTWIGSVTTAMTDVVEVDIAGCGQFPELNTGSYAFTGETYNDAPVYQMQSGAYTVSVYRRQDYRWYLDYNEISEDWDGTIDHAVDPSWWPWEATYYNGCVMTDSEGDEEAEEEEDSWYALKTFFQGDDMFLQDSDPDGIDHDGAAYMSACEANGGQQWQIVPEDVSGEVWYRFQTKSMGTDTCLESNDIALPDFGGGVFMNSCQDSSAQLWQLTLRGPGRFYFRAMDDSSMCLEGNDPVMGWNNGNAIMTPCTPQSGQAWTLEQTEVTRVFVTSSRYAATFGGVTNANALCQSHADAAGLGGTWAAWMSDSTEGSPSENFEHSTHPYQLVDGTVIASDWDDLTDGDIDTLIGLDEYGASRTGYVWTGTTTNGTAAPQDCSDWTATDYTGKVGSANDDNGGTRPQWWSTRGNLGCSGNARLYCFEQ